MEEKSKKRIKWIIYILILGVIGVLLLSLTDKIREINLTKSLYDFSSNDFILTFKGFSSMLDGSPASGGINFIQTRPEAKSGIWWDAYDSASDSTRPVAWMVAHYNSSSGNGVHQHFSIETLDNSTGTPSINSHFAISYDSTQKRAKVTFPGSDIIIQSGNGNAYACLDSAGKIYRSSTPCV